MRFALAVLSLAALGGCLAAAPLGLDDWAGLDAPGRQEVAVRVLAESDVTALSRELYALPAPTRAAPVIVGGFVPGRVPGRRTELVVVGTALGGPSASALLDAATAIAARARYGQAPERTVLVALWPHGAGPADVLALPLWPASQRRAVLWVGADGPPSGTPDAAPPERVDLPAALPRAEASARLQARILRAATVPDTTGRTP